MMARRGNRLPGNRRDKDKLLLRVTSVSYDVEDDGTLVVHVAGRGESGERVTRKVLGTVPYFYAERDEATGFVGDDRVRAITEGYESYDGHPLTRVETQTPKQVGQLAEEATIDYEADIPYYRRCSIDYNLSGYIRVPRRQRCSIEDIDTDPGQPNDPIEPRVLIGDIEVLQLDQLTVDEMLSEYSQPISHITVWDSHTDEYVVLFLDPDGRVEPSDVGDTLDAHIGDTPVSDESDRDIHLRRFNDEQGLLRGYVTLIQERRPDIVTGWNWVEFDWDYLLGRMSEIDMGDLSRHHLSDVGYVSRRRGMARLVDGLPAIDLMDSYCETMTRGEFRSKGLDYVAKRELDAGKLPSVDITEAYDERPSELLAYNVVDVMLTVTLDRREAVVEFMLNLSELSQVALADTRSTMRLVDGYLMSRASDDEVLPSMDEKDIPNNAGGLVLNPADGIEDWVGVIDLKSLYPSVIITWNISPETAHFYDDETPGSPDHMNVPWLPDADHADGGEFTSDAIEWDEMWTDLRREGFVPKYLRRLFPERAEFKRLRDENDPDAELYGVYDRKQAAVKVLMNCFDGDTEVLTPDGVRNIKELDIGDGVYSIDPDTQELEVKPVTDTTHSPNLYGELYDIQGQSVDLGVTPNHRMLVEDENTGGTEFVEAQDLEQTVRYNIPSHRTPRGDEKETWDWVVDGGLDGWVYLDYDEHGRTFKSKLPGEVADRCTYEGNRRMYSIPAKVYARYADEIHHVAKSVGYQSGHKEATFPVRVEMDTLIRLVGWYVAEGCVGTQTNKRGGSSTTLSIAQEDEENRRDIAEMVESLGVNAGVSSQAVEMSVRSMAKWFEGECGRVAPEKRLPEFVFDLSTRQKEMVLETLIDGDGCRTDNGSMEFTTISDELRDDVLRLAVECGYKPDYNRDSGVWRVYLSDYGDSFDLDNNGDVVDHDDDVYCVTVEDNHTVLAGRNGKFQWVGQSMYGVMSNDYWRLGQYGLGDAVTSAARYALWMGKQVSEEQGFGVIYGDTDSVLVSLAGHDDDKPTALENGEALETVINQEMTRCVDNAGLGETHPYLDSGDELHGTARHALVFEHEKLYRRFIQPGSKKRYAGRVVWKEGKDIDGEVDTTGFEATRSDAPEITEEVQPEVINRVLAGDGFDEVSEYIRGVIDDIESGDIDRYRIAIPGSLGQPLEQYGNTQTARACRFSNRELDTSWSVGDNPWLYYIESTPAMSSGADVIALDWASDVPDGYVVDIEKHLDRALASPLEPILDEVGFKWTELKNGAQTTSAASAGWSDDWDADDDDSDDDAGESSDTNTADGWGW